MRGRIVSARHGCPKQVKQLNRIYEILKNTAGFAGKLKLDEAKNRLMIVFHEYLCLTYIEGNYTTARDEGLIRNEALKWIDEKVRYAREEP